MRRLYLGLWFIWLGILTWAAVASAAAGVQDTFIFHVVKKEDWNKDFHLDYSPASLKKEKFIHCATASQLVRVADLFFKGRKDVMVLVIDATLVNAPLKYEKITGSNEAFPHIYGPLNRDAVLTTHFFTPKADGRFDWPVGLDLEHLKAMKLQNLKPDQRELLREFKKAQVTEIQAIKHQNSSELKELEISQSARQSAWRKKKETDRKAFFRQTLDSGKRRMFMMKQDMSTFELSNNLKKEKTRRMKEHDGRLEQTVENQRLKLRTFIDQLVKGKTPEKKLWPRN